MIFFFIRIDAPYRAIACSFIGRKKKRKVGTEESEEEHEEERKRKKEGKRARARECLPDVDPKN